MKIGIWVVGSWLALLSVASCGGGNEGAAVDPRCVSVCTIHEPEVAGAGDVCSATSAEQCQKECSAHVADVNSLCATCLLEQACFEPSCGPMGNGNECDASGQCTVSGREGSCTYPAGDQAAREDCLRQVDPRRAVECSTEYRPVSECSDVCAAAASSDAAP